MLCLMEKLTESVQCRLLWPVNTTYVIDYEQQLIYCVYGWKARTRTFLQSWYFRSQHWGNSGKVTIPGTEQLSLHNGPHAPCTTVQLVRGYCPSHKKPASHWKALFLGSPLSSLRLSSDRSVYGMWGTILKLLLEIATKVHIKKDPYILQVSRLCISSVAGIYDYRTCDFRHTDEVLSWYILEVSKSINSCHLSPYFGIPTNSFADIPDNDYFRTAMTNITLYSKQCK